MKPIKLPTSTPVKKLIPPIIKTGKTNVSVPIPKLGNSKIGIQLPSNLKIQNNKFLKTLGQLQRPIDRLQGLASGVSNTINKGVKALTNVSKFQQNVSSKINSSIKKATNLSISIAGAKITVKLPVPNIVSKITSIPNVVGNVANKATGVVSGFGTSILNNNLGSSVSSMTMCGAIANFLKSAINGLMSSLLQMQRSIMALLDSIVSEVIDVIEQAIDNFLSLLPEVNLEWAEKLIDDKLKSILAQISKFVPIINRIMKEISDCLALLGTAMAILAMAQSLFGNDGASKMSNLNRLYKCNNLGNINNIERHIKQNYPHLSSIKYKKPIKSVSSSKPHIDKDGNVIDKNGNIIGNVSDGISIDKDGNIIDKDGNIIEYTNKPSDGYYNKDWYNASSTDENYENDSVEHTAVEQTQANKSAIDTETNLLEEDLNKSMKELEDSIINSALEETLNPENKDAVDDLKNYTEETLEPLSKDISEIRKELEIQYEEAVKRLEESHEPNPFVNEFKKVLDEIKELDEELKTIVDCSKEIIEKIEDDTIKIIQSNTEIMKNVIEEARKDISDTLAEQRRDLDEIFKTLEREAEIIDQQTPEVVEKQDDSCQT